MISPLFADAQYQSLRAQLDVAEVRQKALAANVANVNTPGYRRRDLSPAFETEFRRALEQGDLTKLTELNPQIIVDDQTTSLRGDGNNVNLEREMIALVKNSAQYEVSAAIVAKKFQGLRMAITGK